MPSYSELVMHLQTPFLPHTKRKVTQALQAISLGSPYRMSLLYFMACENCSTEHALRQEVSCCCPPRLVIYWARNAPSKLGEREIQRDHQVAIVTVSSCPHPQNDAHAAFYSALYFYLYISKCDCGFSEAIILLPLTSTEVHKNTGLGYCDNTPPKSIKLCYTMKHFTCYFIATIRYSYSLH